MSAGPRSADEDEEFDEEDEEYYEDEDEEEWEEEEEEEPAPVVVAGGDDPKAAIEKYYEDEDEEFDEDEDEDDLVTAAPGVAVAPGGGGAADDDDNPPLAPEDFLEGVEEEKDAGFAAVAPDIPDDDESIPDDERRDKFQDAYVERLSLAYAVATKASPGRMRREEFRRALAALGKVFTVAETEQFFVEAVTYQSDDRSLRTTAERDERGLLRRAISAQPSSSRLAVQYLREDGFRNYVERFLTRHVDPKEAEGHFRALVEGAAERALSKRKRAGGQGATTTSGGGGNPPGIDAAAAADHLGGADDPSAPGESAANEELQRMRDLGKSLPLKEVFIYARDLRRVMVTFAETLTDEEADQLIRECRPKPKRGAGDGGLPRIYFSQYLSMLKDDTL